MKNPKKKPTRHLDSPEVESCRALMNAFQMLYRTFDEALLKDGCTYSRFQLLFFLYFEGSMAPVDLSRKMLVTRSNITMFLRRMMTDKLVTECPESISQKRPCYMLTPKGKSFFEALLPKHIKRVHSHMPALSAETIAIFETLSKSI